MKLIISNEEERLIYFAMSYGSSGECKVYVMGDGYEVGTGRILNHVTSSKFSASTRKHLSLLVALNRGLYYQSYFPA